MRLWSLHPKYLDVQGLVALWREALLAQAVLRGQTRGYRNHPQLLRFKNNKSPFSSISVYLQGIYNEASARGYAFDKTKIMPARKKAALAVTHGQMIYEWRHLLSKLKKRNTGLYRSWRNTEVPEAHPIFKICPGAVEPWEKLPD